MKNIWLQLKLHPHSTFNVLRAYDMQENVSDHIKQIFMLVL